MYVWCSWMIVVHYQVSKAKRTVEAGKGSNNASLSGMHRELMRLPSSHQTTSNQYAAQDNDDFIESESDRQMLLIKYFFPSLFLLLFIWH